MHGGKNISVLKDSIKELSYLEILPKLPNLVNLETYEKGNFYKMLFSQFLPSDPKDESNLLSALPSTTAPPRNNLRH